MTEIFRSNFYRTKQPEPLDEEEQAAPAGGANGSDKTAGSCGGDTRCCLEGVLYFVVIVAFLVSCLAIYYLLIGGYYLLIGSFCLPPEPGEEVDGRVIVVLGGVMLAIAGPVLAVGLALCYLIG